MNNRGSLTIEATIILPLVILIIYFFMLLPISKIYFNVFEGEVIEDLMRTTSRSFNVSEINDIIERHPQLEIKSVFFRLNEVEVTIAFNSIYYRKWLIKYDIRVPNVETLIYITDTGKKFHHFGCVYLRESMIPIIYSKGIIKYDACKACSFH
ncbi:MAG: hypothetical protein U9Q80_05670 [Bacillota bacterium]|nr:hypothetical protein [Bacillota bacterium]